MKVIGITGGVGAGKSRVLDYIKSKYRCRVILADTVGNEVKEPGSRCYEQLITLLGREILTADGRIDKGKMAAVIFTNQQLLSQVNEIIHPAVTAYILEEIRMEKHREEQEKAGFKGQSAVDFFFIEAALLIECGYEKYVDELWYVFADEAARTKRLQESRQYSKEKITGVMSRQLSEKEFRKACQVVIDNSGDFEQTKIQIDTVLGDRLWKIQKNIPDN